VSKKLENKLLIFNLFSCLLHSELLNSITFRRFDRVGLREIHIELINACFPRALIIGEKKQQKTIALSHPHLT